MSHSRHAIPLFALCIIAACVDNDNDSATGDGGSGDGGSSDGGSSDGGSADGGSSDGGSTDGGSGDGGSGDGGSASTGLTGYLGDAVAGPDAYAGTEEWYFKTEDDTDLCRVRSTLSATGPRTDCGDCEWAHDLVRSDPTILAEASPGCATLTGIDISTLDGTTVSYGFDADYFGHGKVLMVELAGTWTATSFASWNETTGAFTYDREDGFFEYR